MRPALALPRYAARLLAILVVALAVALVAAPSGGKVNAQGQLTLTDLDRAAREVELLARIEAGRLVPSGVTLYLGTDAANAPPSTPPATVRTQGLAPPAQVSGVRASALSDTKIGVSWSAAAKADGYLVQWRTRGQSFDAARQASVAGTNHKITGLVYSTDYRIQVIATRAGAANGPPSQPATARTDPPPAPGRVSRVRASARSDTEIGVSWSPARNADGYLVQWAVAGQPFDAARQASVVGTSHKITGLVYSTKYFIQVVATRTGAANGPPSDPPATATTHVPPAPGRVSRVRASARSDTEIGVSWSPARNADGYLVQWTTVGQSFDEIRQTIVAGTTSHTITGLAYSTEYFVRVTATRTGAAKGTPSDPPATATTNAPPTPAQVSGVQASARSDTAISVSWSTVANADGYLVQWAVAGQPFNAARQASVAGTGHTITGLAYSTDYRIQVAATRTGAANGAPSQPATARTNPLPAPGRVSGVQASARSDTRISVSWSPAANADGYLVRWAIGGQPFDEIRQTSVTSASHTITGLEYSTEYFIQVVATRTGAANGLPSEPPATATTNVPPTPAQVSGVIASARSESEVSVSWSPAANATAYVVEWRPDGESHAADRRAVVAGTEVVIEDLRSETEYFIRVVGTRRGAANGPASDEDTALTLESALKSAIKRFPGGNEVAMQMSLVAFAGVLTGVRFRSRKSPQREAMILGFMCAASLILPIIGIGSLFWTGGIVLLVAASSAAAYFLMSR